ncbi:pol protein [Cucumis melo var. makuwa]|uniref:Pol protein n=1 Tax=Cucumis melo var. makuwa TaxID=1194695 RepID=A0A5D3DU88_CUCMM|nr:pol protein [Cucumis melo var. makuwa]TYK27072.1 pol protein [Cucumis melo var. makuwa]
MRQRRWLELVKDYDCEILQHPGKADVVADALSRKVSHSAALITEQAPLLRDFERAEIAVSLNDPFLVEKRRLVEAGKNEEFSIASVDGLMFERRLCIPVDSVVKTELLTKVHSSPFSMHPGSEGTKTEASRLTKSAHFIPRKSTYIAKMLVSLPSSGRDFSLHWARGCWDSHLHLMEFAYNNSYQATIDMAPFEVVYGRCCRSPVCWGERKDLEFDVGDIVFLKVELMKGVVRFEKKGKLSPCFVGPFEVLERIGPVAYRLALSPTFFAIHNMFHVSMLRKYVVDPKHVIDFEPLQINENMSYEKQLVEILARQVKTIRNGEITLVKSPQVVTTFRKPFDRVFFVFLRVIPPCSSVDDEAASIAVSLHSSHQSFFVNRQLIIRTNPSHVSASCFVHRRSAATRDVLRVSQLSLSFRQSRALSTVGRTFVELSPFATSHACEVRVTCTPV